MRYELTDAERLVYAAAFVAACEGRALSVAIDVAPGEALLAVRILREAGKEASDDSDAGLMLQKFRLGK